MSLVPYKEGSVILDDPASKSLVIVYPSNGSLEFFEQVFDTENNDLGAPWDQTRRASIASFVCPQCGTEINPTIEPIVAVEGTETIKEHSSKRTANGRSYRSRNNLSRKYFKLLESSHRHYTLEEKGRPVLLPKHQYFIPENLFIPGYFRKFFKTLSLLGNGARGSVYKVVHKIGDIDLGIFALKKIPIGNDMIWFQKCIREVKALSSLTHRSANLITYNHVWLEMNTACGLVRTLDGRQSDTIEDIPCIFILQQYCSGGNLEDFVLKDVFQKFQDHESSEERKRKFLYRRQHPNEALGLSTKQAGSIIRDIATGLQELHDIGLIHRDLKPSNCLLLEKITEGCTLHDYLPTIVIGDLGECQMDGESRTATGATGTLEFTAPEVIIPGTGRHKPTNYNEYTFASDMYSLGMICYFIIFGQLPFESHLEIGELKQNILRFTFDKESLYEKHRDANLNPIDTRMFDLMELLLSQDINKRPSAAEVVELLDEILECNIGINSEQPSSNDELKFVNEDELSPVEDELLVTESNEVVDTNKSISSAPATFRISAVAWRKVLYTAINLALALFVVSHTVGKSIQAYLALVLLGMSFNTKVERQKWIVIVLVALAIKQL